MKKFLITTMILGLSSAAFADSYRAETPSYAAPSAGLHDRDGHDFRRRPMPELTMLSANQKLSGKETIRVRSQQAFSKLELQAVSGSTRVDSILIKFDNGRSQTIALGKRVAVGTPIVIDLPGQLRKIARVTLFGQSGRRAAINLLAV